jgi:hypothetical protein
MVPNLKEMKAIKNNVVLLRITESVQKVFSPSFNATVNPPLHIFKCITESVQVFSPSFNATVNPPLHIFKCIFQHLNGYSVACIK